MRDLKDLLEHFRNDEPLTWEDVNDIEDAIETAIVLKSKVEDLEKTLQKAVDDLEELIVYYHACTYCAHNLPGYSCKLEIINDPDFIKHQKPLLEVRLERILDYLTR